MEELDTNPGLKGISNMNNTFQIIRAKHNNFNTMVTTELSASSDSLGDSSINKSALKPGERSRNEKFSDAQIFNPIDT